MIIFGFVFLVAFLAAALLLIGLGLVLGLALLAWEEGDSTGRIFLKGWDGTAWREMDQSATGEGVGFALPYGHAPSLALDAAGKPFVSWTSHYSSTVHGDIYLRNNPWGWTVPPTAFSAEPEIQMDWEEQAPEFPQL